MSVFIPACPYLLDRYVILLQCSNDIIPNITNVPVKNLTFNGKLNIENVRFPSKPDGT